jgi:lysophospholipase L1-like esterase
MKKSIKTKPTVYIAGDSTVMTYKPDSAPQAGWGQFIHNYFSSDVNFENHSIAGRSSKSFISEGRLDKISNKIQPNDYLFIQFGHNDAAIDKPERYTKPYTEYKEYLKKYIDVAHSKNAIPVLFTPVGMLTYKDDEFINDFPDYCKAMKQVAEEEHVSLIDLMSESLKYYDTIGYDETYQLFMVSSNGTDHAHFTEKGANRIARIVSQGVKELTLPISKFYIEEIS